MITDLLSLMDQYGIEAVVLVGLLVTARRYGPTAISRLVRRHDIRERHDLERQTQYQNKTERLYERLLAMTEPTLAALRDNTAAIGNMSAVLERTVESLDEQIPAILATLERLSRQVETTNTRVGKIDKRVGNLEEQNCEDVKL